MRDAKSERGQSGQRDRSGGRRWIISVIIVTVLLTVPGVPVTATADVLYGVGKGACALLTLGICAALWPAPPFGTAPQAEPTVPVNCSNPVMTTAPRFLSWPKGAAKYPFSARCNSPEREGMMTVTWEGSWTPSETRPDRPNASETLTITGYEPFIPGREPGGKIYMYWTARCNADPWLQGGACSRFGAYVPDDLQTAFPDMGNLSFPRTANAMSPALRQQQFVEYQRVNSQISMSPANRQSLQAMNQSQTITTQPKQAQSMIVAPQTTTPNATMGSIVARPNIRLRGVESTEPQPSPQLPEDAQSASTQGSAPVVTDESAGVILEPVTLTLDRPLHIVTAMGKPAVLEPGIYEIEAILDLDLGLAREGQPTVLLHANPAPHSEAIQRSLALLVPGQTDDEQYIVFLTPDGKRLDAHGSTSDVSSRSTEKAVALPDRKLKNAIMSASAQPASGPLAPCQANSSPLGPRWIPIPCAMPAGLPGGLPASPVPYVDANNVLHACLNNNTGAFRIVRPADGCVELYGEAKVKWQLAP